MTRTLYKILGNTLSDINWHPDVREDQLRICLGQAVNGARGVSGTTETHDAT